MDNIIKNILVLLAIATVIIPIVIGIAIAKLFQKRNAEIHRKNIEWEEQIRQEVQEEYHRKNK